MSLSSSLASSPLKLVTCSRKQEEGRSGEAQRVGQRAAPQAPCGAEAAPSPSSGAGSKELRRMQCDRARAVGPKASGNWPLRRRQGVVWRRSRPASVPVMHGPVAYLHAAGVNRERGGLENEGGHVERVGGGCAASPTVLRPWELLGGRFGSGGASVKHGEWGRAWVWGRVCGGVRGLRWGTGPRGKRVKLCLCRGVEEQGAKRGAQLGGGMETLAVPCTGAAHSAGLAFALIDPQHPAGHAAWRGRGLVHWGSGHPARRRSPARPRALCQLPRRSAVQVAPSS